jgi:predicted ATP-dependent endonuclease of OLD family
MAAQTIITTHSPYFIAKSDILDLICCNRDKNGSIYTCLKDYILSEKENKQLKRVFTERKADALFSDFLILGEGKTETLTISTYFESYFGKSIDEMNVTIVDVGGCTDYRPFLIACLAFKIKWAILSDGEENTINTLSKEVNDICGIGSFNQLLNKSIFIIPGGSCYEEYLIAEGYSDMIEEALRSGKYKNRFKCQIKNIKDNNPDYTNQKILSSLLKLDDNKTDYAIIVAEAICNAKKIPPIIDSLLCTIKEQLR